MAKPARRPWAILLFSIPFAGIGIGFLAFSIIPTLYHWQQMSDWQVTQATVHSAELLSFSGDDGTTYQATGFYQYQVDGLDYGSARLGISSGADNVGQWHQKMGGKLRHALRNKSTINVYYDPDHPLEAIVDRKPRWELLGFKMIFVLVFGGSGVGLFWWSCRSHNKIIDTPEAIDKPWLGHQDWVNATILSDAKSRQYLSWGFALFWNLISSPVLVSIPRELDQGNNAILIAAVFPLVGIGLLVWAIKTTLRWRSIGATPLTLDPYPGSIGGQVGGCIETNVHYRAQHKYPVTLSCLYSYVSGSGKNRSRKESVKWQATGYARVEAHSFGTRLFFCFDLPDELPESQSKDERYHLWRLNLKSEGLDRNLDRNFELPVFCTAKHSSLVRVDTISHPLAREKREEHIQSVMDMQQTPEGLALHFPPGRNTGPKISLLIFGLLFFGAGMGAGYLGAPLVFPLIFGTVGGGMALGSLYSLANSLSVRIGQSGIQNRRTLLGLVLYRRSASATDVRELRIHKGGSVSSGTEHKIFFSIKAHLNNGKKITVAESLIGRTAAEQAAEAIALYSGFDCNMEPVNARQEFARRKQAYQQGGKKQY